MPLIAISQLEHRRLVRFFRLLPVVLGALVFAVGCLALVGWAFDIGVLKGAVRGKVPMVPLSALSFAIAGMALLLAQFSDNRPAIWASRLLAVGLGALAMASLFEFALNAGLGLGMHLFQDELVSSGARASGRMAINTAFAFLFFALGVLLLKRDRDARRLNSQFLGTLVLIVSFLAVVGYTFGVRNFYSFQLLSGMSLYSAIAFTLLGTGLLFSQLDRGVPALLIDAGAAGFVARRLIPGTLVLPLIFTLVRVAGEDRGLIDSNLGASFVVVADMVAFLLLIAWSARVLRSTDRKRAELLVRERQAHEASERARTDAELAAKQAGDARSEAESANRAKSDFLAVMSHELRTPLSAIMGYQELLADGITGPVNEQQAQQLGRIKVSARHLLSLIDEILTFTRLDAGQETLTIGPADLSCIIDESVELVEPLAHARHLGVQVVKPLVETIIQTDPTKVRQMLVNLLSNAVKFTDEGSVRVTGEVVGGQVILTVSDTGVGIEAEHHQRIFEPFWQVEQKATRRSSGTGLGLTVTRRLANLMGGDINVTSESGRGTTFTIMLPVEVVPLAAVRPNMPALRAG